MLAAGCERAQGYRYGRPDAADRIVELLTRFGPDKDTVTPATS